MYGSKYVRKKTTARLSTLRCGKRADMNFRVYIKNGQGERRDVKRSRSGGSEKNGEFSGTWGMIRWGD